MDMCSIFHLFIEERYLDKLCTCQSLYYRLFHWGKFGKQDLLYSSDWEDSKKHIELHYNKEMIEDIHILQPLDYFLL